MKPSQVFFGDNLIKGVFPKKKPKTYAAISLITMRPAGRRNLQTGKKIVRTICSLYLIAASMKT